jgi:hypothetical protein
MHPGKAPAVVQSSNRVSGAIIDFHGRLGIESGRQALEAKRWVDAAVEVRSKALETGTEGFDAARHLGSETLDRAKSATDRLSGRIGHRRLPWTRGDED